MGNRVYIKEEECIGCESCVELCPEVFGFNEDGLLENKNRYGYMACPCRLAADDREWDRDIICPCGL